MTATQTEDQPRALVPDNKIHELAISHIHPSEHNPRTTFPDDALDELGASLQAAGVLVPLIVEADLDTPGEFILFDGERRYRAAQRIGMRLLPCIVRRYKTPEDRITAMLVTTLQRDDLEPLDEAAAYQALIDLDYSYTQIAQQVGRSKSHISKRVALLKLAPEAQAAVTDGALNLETAAGLAKLAAADAATLLGDATDSDTGELDAAKVTEKVEERAPKKPRAPKPQPASGPASSDRPPAHPAAARGHGTNQPSSAGARAVLRAHLARIVAGDTQPYLRNNTLIQSVCAVVGTLDAPIVCDPRRLVDLVDGTIVEAARSSRPPERTSLLVAFLLDGIEDLIARGHETEATAHAFGRLLKETGYKGP